MVMAKQPQVGGDVKERAWQVCPSPSPPSPPGTARSGGALSHLSLGLTTQQDDRLPLPPRAITPPGIRTLEPRAITRAGYEPWNPGPSHLQA
jgi:hypothetical protein